MTTVLYSFLVKGVLQFL